MRTTNRVSAIIIKNDKILLIHRKKLGDEYWVVPGGGVEEGESIDQALEREVWEETSCHPKKYKLIHEEKDDMDHIQYYYEVELEDGEIKLGGLEAHENNPDNWYNLEWVTLDFTYKIEQIYPISSIAVIKKTPVS